MFKLAIVILAVVGMSMACQTRKRRDEFDTFKRQYRKNYATEIEAERRCQIFSDNMDKIESHNVQFSRGLSTYTLGMNKFADLTNEEFLALYTGLNAPSEEERQDDSADVFRADPNFKAPTSVVSNSSLYETIRALRNFVFFCPRFLDFIRKFSDY